jgi:putative serine protease PepD
MGWRGLVAAVVLAVLAAGTLARGGDGSSTAPLTDDELRLVSATARDATVLVSARSCGQLVRGSAFAVSGRLVTNRHVVSGAAEVVVAGSAVVEGARVLDAHASLDLAVVSGVGTPELELATDRPGVGTPVVLAGRPGGGPVAVATSTVHLYGDGRPWGMSGEVLLLDTPTGAGWSGGPVLDRRGRVVAVLAAQDQVTGLALAVPVTDLGPWLGQAHGEPIDRTPACPPGDA